MTVDQLPGRVREFANYLNGLLARLDQGGGWCAVFWQRDPDGMQACLGGREVPPWDVVAALLQDFATAYGPDAAARAAEQARQLHAGALAAYDARPGVREELSDRLDVMLREQRYAAERLAQLGRAYSSAHSREEAESLDIDLAWARDDHERASARCAELRARMERLERQAEAGPPSPGPAAGPTPPVRATARTSATAQASATGTTMRGRSDGVTPDGSDAPPSSAPQAPEAPTPAPASAPAPAKQRKRRRGSARFAGMAEDEAVPAAVPQTPEAAVSADPGGRRTPRGARFAGAAEAPVRPEPVVEQADEQAGQAVTGAVARLERLRAEGRTGEAHALLAEAAQWPAARFPLLADALQRAGLGADWATLLWETASLPAARLVAAADALTAAGRTTDGRQILRQGVVRPATEIGQAVLALDAAGRHREVRALLDTYVQVRTPEEAAHSAEPDPHRLVPLLLRSAQAVSDQRHWDLLHALRVAGLTS
ncbi:hypothetical protein ABZ642_01085 [Streptomyces sp. NPDC007157]|uniref:hypothetical protein n=1 Tax=Streptomyces sp. NPDC007157 TaxID=3154681 RepID=UPI0033D6CF0B